MDRLKIDYSLFSYYPRKNRKRNLKKNIFTICFLILIIGILCCIKNTNKFSTQKQTTIQFASWGSESEISILKPILSDFEKENPNIKIDFMHIPQNYFQKIHLLFASNTAPDVIFMNNQYLPIYANAGVLEDLSPYTNDFEYKKFFPIALKTLSYKEKIYAIPRDVSTLVVFYNKDIFDKYNIPYPNKNWDINDLLSTAQKLTHVPQVFGISFEEEPLFYLPYLNYFGVKNLAKNTTQMQDGLNFYANLRTKYHVAPKKEESASATMAQMFLQEKLGMQISGRWLVPKYRQEAKFRWDIVRFPDNNGLHTSPVDASGWAISKSSKHKQEAIKLVKYLSSKENSEKFTQSGLIVPARIDVANSKAFLDNKSPQNSKEFLEILNNATPTPVTLNFKEVTDNMKTQNERLFNK